MGEFLDEEVAKWRSLCYDRKMRPSARQVCGLAALLTIAACGGSGGGIPDATQTLSGTITTTTFSLAAGETRRVNGDLRIEASNDISIDGKLLVDEGVEIVLIAGDEISLGEIQPSGKTISGRGLTRDTVNTVIAGRNANIRASQTWPPRTNVCLVANNAGNVTIGGSMTVQNSANATARNRTGDPGGSIYIGGLAVAIAQVAGAKNATNPGVLTINANLKAGDGGRGGDDINGEGSRPVVMEPGRGGRGGTIEIGAATLFFGGARLTPGRGGDAGWAGRPHGAPEGVKRSRNGSSRYEVGETIKLQATGQAFAGQVIINAPAVTGAPNIDKIPAGQPASFFVAPGTGGVSGNGGDLVVTGFQITNGLNSERKPTPSNAVVEVVDGGNGGVAADKVSLGGIGGAIVCKDSKNQESIATFRLINSFRGGTGFDGCSVNPVTNGTKGGNAGLVEDILLPKLQLQGRALHGGDGGDFAIGVRPLGGDAGKSTSGTVIGQDGTPGRPCAEVAMLMLLNANVVYNGVTLGSKGQEVSVSRFRGYSYSNGEAGCPKGHLHGTVYFDDKGPIEDPDPTGCGHAHER